MANTSPATFATSRIVVARPVPILKDLAVNVRRQPCSRLDERITNIVDIDEVPRRIRVDQGRERAFQTFGDQIRNQTGQVFEGTVDGIESQVHNGKAANVPNIRYVVARRGLRNGIMAVRLKGRLLQRARAIGSVFRRTSRMNERGKPRVRQQFYQLDQGGEVGSIDQFLICLERIGAIGDAIEDGAGANVGHEVPRRREIDEIGFQNVTTVNAVETPGGKRANDAEHVLTVFEQAAQKVGSDEAARPKHQDWSAQSAYPVARSPTSSARQRLCCERDPLGIEIAAPPQESLRAVGRSRAALGGMQMAKAIQAYSGFDRPMAHRLPNAAMRDVFFDHGKSPGPPQRISQLRRRRVGLNRQFADDPQGWPVGLVELPQDAPG